MRKKKMIQIGTKVSPTDHATIIALAASRNLSIGGFLRMAALTSGEMEQVYCDDDRRLLLYLRDELRQEGCRLTEIVRTLNVEKLPADDAIKAELVNMQRTLAALCVELSAHRKDLLKKRPQGGRDAPASLRLY